MLPPVACDTTDDGLPPACSYRPGGRDAGRDKEELDIAALTKYIAMAKSVESKDPRFWVSESCLIEFSVALITC